MGAWIKTLEYGTHWNTKLFEVWIFNGLVLGWSVIAIAIGMVLTIPKLSHCKNPKKLAAIFVPISNGFGQNGRHFVQNRTPLEPNTIEIPNTFGIPAPAVIVSENYTICKPTSF